MADYFADMRMRGENFYWVDRLNYVQLFPLRHSSGDQFLIFGTYKLVASMLP